MHRTITEIRGSKDLAELLNSHQPATPEDAAETPLDWPGVALFGGETYEVDRDTSTATRLVLADGLAAVDYRTEWHESCPMFDTAAKVSAPHWCPAVYDIETWEDAEAEVTRDWRSVYVGHGSFAETTKYATLDEAQAAYSSEVATMDMELVKTGEYPSDGAPEYDA